MFTTLTITFRNNQKPYELKRQAHVDQRGEQLVARVNSALHESETTSVFRAKSQAFPENEQLVLKIIYGPRKSSSVKALRHEFDMYSTKLAALQGHVVPRCHGLFEGRTTAGYVACLVLDYVGETSFLLVEELSMEFRLDVLRGLLAIHKAGLEHGDFNDANVVFDEQQKPWIIDFETARPHVCHHGRIDEGVRIPSLSDFKCREIWDFCSDVSIWRHRTLRFSGVTLDEDYITSVDYIMQVTKDAPHIFASVPRDKLLKGAEDLWAALQVYDANNNVRPRDYEHFTGVSMEDYSKAKDLEERQQMWEKMIEERDAQYEDSSDGSDNGAVEDDGSASGDSDSAGRFSADDTDETDDD